MRALLAALAALALGACNQVYSRTPLLGEAPARPGDPDLRPGLWSIEGMRDDKCPFDIRQTINHWPDCATAAEYRNGQLWLITPHERILAQNVKLAGDDPVLMQQHWLPDALKDPRAPEPTDSDNPFFGWTYASLTVVRTDALGRIMEARMLAPACGPLPAGGAGYTDRPFPGLTMVKSNCVAPDLDTVRAALARSQALVPAQIASSTIRWIRDDP
jgi:hypothetical protein